ncbi:ISNCY family transposase [Mahella australiensis]|nr:ISNCY family transposase [Mahella australiensis]AEE95359.1 Integrase catalytic region [Mahella australiensis 50-1 BON]AEE95456.1 Integrase catalytic region [Mahella australiensis 50-1 BON]AEE95896.1 Integrase catalytic region [Mahella australiensis 50-1 BON]AEE96578.1 Integrase catalytic region [Mahella australiensis 50-1 BON]AEE97426.1 Integrase catalytic region [Mahella australiensis 50-1 BON]
MTESEMQKLVVINKVIDGTLTASEAAQVLDLSVRQIFRLKKGVKEQGASFVIHKNRGRKPANALSDELVNHILTLRKEKYFDTNFSHFRDLLEDDKGIILSNSSVYRILDNAGIQSPRKHRRPRKIHARRERMPQAGMLVQIDCTSFEWIPSVGNMALHGAIDDATGQVLALYFTENECMNGYFELMRTIIGQYGIPISLYADKHTIFASPNKGKISIEEQLEGKVVNETQFQMAMSTLGISIINARSPQAKGRVERLWNTLQDRLRAELRIYGIDSMEKANEFLPKFLERYNKRFAIEPQDPEPAFRELPPDIDLDNILCVKLSRKVDNGGVFSLHSQYYQVVCDDGKTVAPIVPRAKITVLTSPRIGIRVQYGNNIYAVKKLDEPPKKAQKANKASSSSTAKPYKPSPTHPWKQGWQKAPSYWYEESDREILEALYNSSRAWH